MPRGTDYDPKHIEGILKFFREWEPYVEVTEEIVSGGRAVKIKKLKPNTPPTLNKYAIKIGVDRNTLRVWAENNAEFHSSYAACKAIQEEFLCDKGLSGEYNSNITKFMLVNHTELKDKTESEQVVRTESVEEYLKRIASEENN